MKLEINLPDVAEVTTQSCPVPIARQQERWSAKCLGDMRKERGVYVIHHDGKIKYIGKTDGPKMSFGRRLRAEFREKSSRGRHIYPKLSTLRVPPEIMVHCFTSNAIKQRIKTDGKELSSFQLIGIFESAMIYHLDPEFQEHHVTAMANYVQKVITKHTGRQLNPENAQAFFKKVKGMIK